MIRGLTLVEIDVLSTACMYTFGRWNCALLMVFINLYWNRYLHTRRRLFSFRSKYNVHVYLILMESLAIDTQQHCQSWSAEPRFSFCCLMFFQELSLPLYISSRFQKLLFILSSISAVLVTTAILLWLTSSLGGGVNTIPVSWFTLAMKDVCFHTFKKEMVGTYTAWMVTAMVGFLFSQMVRHTSLTQMQMNCTL